MDNGLHQNGCSAARCLQKGYKNASKTYANFRKTSSSQQAWRAS